MDEKAELLLSQIPGCNLGTVAAAAVQHIVITLAESLTVIGCRRRTCFNRFITDHVLFRHRLLPVNRTYTQTDIQIDKHTVRKASLNTSTWRFISDVIFRRWKELFYMWPPSTVVDYSLSVLPMTHIKQRLKLTTRPRSHQTYEPVSRSKGQKSQGS